MAEYHKRKEYRKKLSKIRLARKKRLGYLNSPETRKKMRLAKLGKPSNNKGGWKHTKKTKTKISKSLSGKNNPRWKGGISRTYREKYYSKKFKKWRLKVFIRDNYTCRNCQKVGGRLTAHHIKSWAKYPKLRFVVSNGITLCEKCHSKTDNFKRKLSPNK